MGIIINKKKMPQFSELKDFFAYAKANKGKLNVGYPGAGTYAHMILLALQDQLGTEFNLVPYKGGGRSRQRSHVRADRCAGEFRRQLFRSDLSRRFFWQSASSEMSAVNSCQTFRR